MLGRVGRKQKPARHEGEKPFWISYADLMTAMMVLFLVAMVASVMAVIKMAAPHMDEAQARQQAILDICTQLTAEFAGSANIKVDCEDNRIYLDKVEGFAVNDYRLPQEVGSMLAEMVPKVLKVADGPLGQAWMKQVLVEGYTDTDGSYLHNLNLSMERAQWVMCLLLDPDKNRYMELTPEQEMRVRQLFMAGGFASNRQQTSKEASRRVEFRLDFYANKAEQRVADEAATQQATGACRL